MSTILHREEIKLMKRKLFSLLLTGIMTAALFSDCSSAAGSSSADSGKTASAESTDSQTENDTSWPEKPIQVIVGFTAGGGTDVTCRVTSKYVEKYLGETLVVSNVVGAGSSVASRQVKDSAPDGYTVLYANDNIITNQLAQTADYGPEEFKTAGISMLSTNVALAGRSELFTNFDEFVEYAKAHPGELKFGVETGSFHAQVAASLMRDLGLDIQIVDVGPIADIIASMAGGHIDLLAGPSGTITDYVEMGDFSIIAMLADERDIDFPDIPTLYEKDVDYSLPKFYSYMFPKDTPDEIVNKFTEAMLKATSDPEYIEETRNMKYTPVSLDRAQADEFMENATKDLVRNQKTLDDYYAGKN